MSVNKRIKLREKAREMFFHGFDGYMKHAFPQDELNPLACTGRSRNDKDEDNWGINDVLGNFCLTLIDSLESIAIIGTKEKFHDAINLLLTRVKDFNIDSRVQVFEVNIRVLGGLLSAHLLATDNKLGYKMPGYKNQLLHLAKDLGDRLLPAFENTKTGIPFPRVNLRSGVLSYETHNTCTAGAGTLVLEFGVLSLLTGDDRYEKVAKRAFFELWERRSPLGLMGNSIDIQSGRWLHNAAGIGAGVDSFFEYSLKAYILFGELDYHRLFKDSYGAVNKWLKDPNDFIFKNVDLETGELQSTWVDSLSAFWSGLQALAGDVDQAIISHQFFFTVWRKFDGFPERFDFNHKSINLAHYPLRPELIESTYMLYQATKNPYYLHVGERLLVDIEKHSRTPCGFASIKNVLTKTLDDRMESFFLSETLKYLYMLFDTENILNTIDSNYVFTTEGHVLPVPYKKLKKLTKAPSPPETCAPKDTHLHQSLLTASPLEKILWDAGHAAIPLPLDVIHKINKAVGILDSADDFFHHVVIPSSESSLAFMHPEFTSSTHLPNTTPPNNLVEELKENFRWLKYIIGKKDAVDAEFISTIYGESNLLLESTLLNNSLQCLRSFDGKNKDNDGEEYVSNNNAVVDEGMVGSKYIHTRAESQQNHIVKVGLPEGVIYEEKAKLFKTPKGVVCNTLKDVVIHLTLTREITFVNGEEVEEEFFIITRADNIIVQRGGVVKVPKRGIFWLLGKEDSAQYSNQHKRPNKVEYERILVEMQMHVVESIDSATSSINNTSADDKKQKEEERAFLTTAFGASAAHFGAAILPGQVLTAPVVPILSENQLYLKNIRVDDVSFGCSAGDYKYAMRRGYLGGNIVMVKRGGCSFFEKAKWAEWAGAAGMMVIGVGFKVEHKTTSMIAGFGNDPNSISLIAVMISHRDAVTILQEMNKNINKRAAYMLQSSDSCVGASCLCNDLDYYCVAMSLVGDLAPPNPVTPPKQIVLQFNDKPIRNLHIMLTAPRSSFEGRWSSRVKLDSLSDPRRRVRGRSMLYGSVDMSCLSYCMTDKKKSCKIIKS